MKIDNKEPRIETYWQRKNRQVVNGLRIYDRTHSNHFIFFCFLINRQVDSFSLDHSLSAITKNMGNMNHFVVLKTSNSQAHLWFEYVAAFKKNTW